MDTSEILNALKDEEKDEFPAHLFAGDPVNVIGHLEGLLEKSGLSIKEIIPKIGFERSYVYHIFSGMRPATRLFCLRLALIMKLDYEEAQRLLYVTGNKLLYAKVESDAVFIYALQRHFSPAKINDLLEEVGEKPLF